MEKDRDGTLGDCVLEGKELRVKIDSVNYLINGGALSSDVPFLHSGLVKNN